MNASHPCTSEVRTARFNLPVCGDSKFRRLLGSLVAPVTRVHRYRNLSAEILEDALKSVECRRCK